MSNPSEESINQEVKTAWTAFNSGNRELGIMVMLHAILLAVLRLS